MKKIIISIFAFALGLNPLFAKEYMQYCASETATKTFVGNLASLSGVNFLSKNIIEHEISKSVKKETNSDFKVNIDNFYGVNILDGEFKNLKAKANEFKYDGFFMSNLAVETLCPYNHVSYKDEKLSFRENMVLKYSTEITQKDLDKTLQGLEYKKIIDKMNSDKIISSLIKIKDSKAKIQNDKLIFSYEVLPLPKYDILSKLPVDIKPLNLSFSTNLKAKEGKLELCDFELNSKKFNYSNFIPIINYLNPLAYSISVDKNNKGENEVQNVTIANSKISIDGIILIKKTEQQQ